MDSRQAKQVAIDSFALIESGNPDLAARIIDTRFINHEAEDDEDADGRREPGPTGFLATSRWLRAAFDSLRFDIADVIGEGELVAVRAFMLGRHMGPFHGLPATGRTIRQAQFHLLTLIDVSSVDGSSAPKIISHRAQRDDLGLLLQLGMRLQHTPAGP